MKKGFFCAAFASIILILLIGCGDGGGGSPVSTGTLSMDITDAKPVIPGNPQELWITFEEVLVHKSGGGWVSLPLPEEPFTINLLAFYDGTTTELVTPVKLNTGKYTQIRFVVSRAYMVVSGVAHEIELGVSSDALKTDKNFDFEVVTDLAVNITVDFDLSQSIVVTGDGEYKIKPVLHINETQEAATICGSIEPLDVGEDPYDVTVIVTRNFDSDSSIYTVYTVVTVARDSEADSAQFCIFWLVPLILNDIYTNDFYTVDIEQNGAVVYTEDVSSAQDQLGAGVTFYLNGNFDIDLPPL
jgi:hypothetical protein